MQPSTPISNTTSAMRRAYHYFRSKHGWTALQAWAFIRTMPSR